MDPMNNSVTTRADMDVGLRDFMLGTYRWMMLAMLVTAGTAWVIGTQFISVIGPLVYNPITLLAFVIAIPVLFGAIGRKLPSMSKGGMLTFLFGFAAFLGVFMAAIAVSFSAPVIMKVFFMTVALFGGLSLFGYTTERNLGTYVKYAFIAFLAYVAINVLGMFFESLRPTGTLDLIITGIALLAISVIVAWETQFLKQTYYATIGQGTLAQNASIYGAASLLLSFVNMFQILLSLFGRD